MGTWRASCVYLQCSTYFATTATSRIPEDVDGVDGGDDDGGGDDGVAPVQDMLGHQSHKQDPWIGWIRLTQSGR